MIETEPLIAPAAFAAVALRARPAMARAVLKVLLVVTGSLLNALLDLRFRIRAPFPVL